MVTTHPMVIPPAKYKIFFTAGSLLRPSAGKMELAMIGVMMENNRPQKLAIPLAVPRTDVGKTSGVQPYNTALNMLWKKYSIALSPILEACPFARLNRIMETPISADEKIIVSLRPIVGNLVIRAARATATIPGA